MVKDSRVVTHHCRLMCFGAVGFGAEGEERVSAKKVVLLKDRNRTRGQKELH